MKNAVCRLSVFVLCLCCLSVGSPAHLAWSEQATDTFAVDAFVVASVQLAVVSIDFGSFAKTNQVDGQGAIQITATNGLPYNIQMGPGSAFVAADGNRRMGGDGGNEFLNYNLFIDAERTLVWGDGSFGYTTGAAGNGNLQEFPVYGRVFAGQQVVADHYDDLLQVTVFF
ncbi:MAG TPA: spore coat U domain-containing protein [Candidatus Eisenbacteria bacterium]|jgi:spore coat protein U-like protein